MITEITDSEFSDDIDKEILSATQEHGPKWFDSGKNEIIAKGWTVLIYQNSRITFLGNCNVWSQNFYDNCRIVGKTPIAIEL